jgi:hypothetical protein
MLPIFSESTAPGLGTASQTDMAFNFMPGAGHNHQSAAGCTSTQFIEYNFTHAHKKIFVETNINFHVFAMAAWASITVHHSTCHRGYWS